MKKKPTDLASVETSQELASVHEDDHGDVTLTLRKGKFAEFILSFLGAKETLVKKYNLDFILELDALLQFHYLLVQKISKEQFISISVATATISYSDNSHRTLNTIESLERFHEYRDIGIKSATISWDFIFRPPDVDSVQLQKVTILFEPHGSKEFSGLITVTVAHTNQVWAVEVVHLFEEQISKISLRYTRVLNILNFAKRIKIFQHFTLALIILIGIGLSYMIVQRQYLTPVITVQDEFKFDIAEVLAKSNNPTDVNLYLQFFLIKDLYPNQISVIRHLYDKKYFHNSYNDIINKVLGGYYNSKKESDNIFWTVEAILDEINAKSNISWVWSYLRFFFLYLITYCSAALYLLLFRQNSIIGLTALEQSRIKTQEKIKSTINQFIFGVGASLIAALIFTFGEKVLLLK